MLPLVSIIIPSYNCAQYLRQAVESALLQSYRALEVVVVDDGSTDESPLIIADLAQAGRVRLVQRTNGGVAAARNTGIAHSAGDYLMFLDCDDYLHPDMVRKLMALLGPEAATVFAYCDYIHVDCNGVPLPDNRPLRDYRAQLEGNILGPLLIGAYLLPVCVVISRTLIQMAGAFDPTYTAGDDYALLLRASCLGATARYLNEPLAYYRHRAGSQSADREHMAALEIAILRDTAARFPEQVAVVVPQLLLEFRHSVAMVWGDGSMRLKQAEQYAASLERALAARDEALHEAATYAESLRATLTQRDEALHEAVTYEKFFETAADDAAERNRAMAMRVSIIIPNHNCLPYLRQAVESALAQSYRPIEVLVVDDGSTDESVAAIADLVDAGGLKLIRQANQGLAAARNVGLAASTGTYVVFLDSDDALHPQLVERLVALVNPDEPQLLAYCDYLKVSVAGEPLPGEYAIGQVRSSHEGNLLAQLLVQNYIQLNGVLFSRAALQVAGGFDTHWQACEDYDLLLRLFCTGACARYHGEALAYYRQRPGSTSANRQLMAEATEAVLQATIARFPAQVAAALPAVVAEMRAAAAALWRASEHWHTQEVRATEAYIISLREVLAAREHEAKEAKRYVHSLEVAFDAVERYAHSLEAAREAAAAQAAATQAAAAQAAAAQAAAATYEAARAAAQAAESTHEAARAAAQQTAAQAAEAAHA